MSTVFSKGTVAHLVTGCGSTHDAEKIHSYVGYLELLQQLTNLGQASRAEVDDTLRFLEESPDYGVLVIEGAYPAVSASFFKIIFFLNALIQKRFFYIMEINNFRGDLTDIPAKKEALPAVIEVWTQCWESYFEHHTLVLHTKHV